ncbi:glycosyltransferase family 2 protein [Novipirellula sp.]|uniref:glycosyltransferase family 2 protein n=1 Tax=Novipirellula sp. TaxID=2795430 RepID=UPI00356803AB
MKSGPNALYLGAFEYSTLVYRQNTEFLKIDNSQTPAISIIIPTYQAGETLENVLESITTQSSQDYEVLIMDGGSSDNTATIASRYCQRYPQIRFHSEPDQGVYHAMNKGIQIARGQWLLFLGSDDLLYRHDTLERVLPVLGDDDDVVYGNVYSTRFGGIYDGEFDNEKIINKNISHQSILFNRRTFATLGYYDPAYKVVADWEFNFRWFLSKQIRKRHIDETISNYADGGMSSRHDDLLFQQNRMLLYLRYGKEQLKLSTKNSILLSELKRALRTRNLRLLVGILRAVPRVYF